MTMGSINAIALLRPDGDNSVGHVVLVCEHGDGMYYVTGYRIMENATQALSYLESNPDNMSADGLRTAIASAPGRFNEYGATITPRSAYKLGYRAVSDILNSPSYINWREVYFGARSFAVLTGKIAAPDPNENPSVGHVPDSECSVKAFVDSDDDFASRRKRRRKRRRLIAEVSEAVEDGSLINVYHPSTSSELAEGSVLYGASLDPHQHDIRNAIQTIRGMYSRGTPWRDLKAKMVSGGTTRTVIRLDEDYIVEYDRLVNMGLYVTWVFEDDGGLYMVGNSSLGLDGKTPSNDKPRPVDQDYGYGPSLTSVHRSYKDQWHEIEESRKANIPPFDHRCETMLFKPTDTKHGGKWYCVRLLEIVSAANKGTVAYEVSISHGRYGQHNFRHKTPEVAHDLQSAINMYMNRVRAKTSKGYRNIIPGSVPNLWWEDRK